MSKAQSVVAPQLFHRCERCGVVLRTNGADYMSEWHARRCGPEGKGCDGVLVVDNSRCQAVIFHGPGHQSTTRCRLTRPHKMHEAIYGSFKQLGHWREMESFTGFFDESPEEDD